ncbi:hypothetical protein [Mycobacterium sp.]|uniref:hypothetical protein n=1 Tax=Mycobacterium sp. TaxID=1785 RepID=UPI0031DBD9D9
MATLPWMRLTRAVITGLALVGAFLVGPLLVGSAPLGGSPVSICATDGTAAVEEPGPPPAPSTDAPANPAPTRATPPPRRRHIDSDPNLRR